MTITAESVAAEFVAAAEAAGLKRVLVLVGRIGEGEFVVTVSLQNPAAVGESDQFIMSSCPYEFVDEGHVKESANAKATMIARALPTIH